MSVARIVVEGMEGERPEPGGSIAINPAKDGARTLSDFLEANGVRLNMRCGGRGLCRGCQVRIGDESNLRRSCQVTVADLSTDAAVEGEACRVSVPAGSRRDEKLHGVTEFELVTEQADVKSRAGIGLALDIGTTTVAGALWDLPSGRCLTTATLANQQRRMGDNVLARIDHSLRPNGGAELQRALVQDTLNPLIAHLCKSAQITAADVSEALVAGNTVMLHTLAGRSLAGLAAYPFEPEFLEPQILEPGALQLAIHCPLETTQCLGPFVGADITMGALAAGMDRVDGSALLIDFGTNGEILLKHDGRYYATATAAGPAFEGGRLNCGAVATEGVIAALSLQPDGRWQPDVIGRGGGDANGGSRPLRGISGAAYVDFLAQARQAGLLTEMGRFAAGHAAVEKTDDGEGAVELRVMLAGGQYVTEVDVAEIMQAKAAIAAGVAVLLEVAGIEAADLDALFVAGGFGFHLNLDHAQTIGLVPQVQPERIRVLGNSSLGGTSLRLLAGVGREAQIAECCEVIELNQIDSFEDHYIDAMALE